MSNSIKIIPLVQKEESWWFDGYDMQCCEKFTEYIYKYAEKLKDTAIALLISAGKMPSYDMLLEFASTENEKYIFKFNDDKFTFPNSIANNLIFNFTDLYVKFYVEKES